MAHTPDLTALLNPPPVPITSANGNWQRPTHLHGGQPAASSLRRFNRVTLGFWLGGLALGTAGCIFGASMSYRHPVAVPISVLWWGIYFGCFGASIGALIGMGAEQPPAPPFQCSDSAGKLPSGVDSAALPPGYNGTLIRDVWRDRDTSLTRSGSQMLRHAFGAFDSKWRPGRQLGRTSAKPTAQQS
jgi:hypothetical protein